MRGGARAREVGVLVSFPDEVRGPGDEHRKGAPGGSVGKVTGGVRQARPRETRVKMVRPRGSWTLRQRGRRDRAGSLCPQ